MQTSKRNSHACAAISRRNSSYIFGIGKTNTNFASHFRTLCLLVVVLLCGNVVYGMKSQYQKETMEKAVDSVRKGEMSCREAAMHYGVHRSTLQRYRVRVHYSIIQLRIFCFISYISIHFLLIIICFLCHLFRLQIRGS